MADGDQKPQEPGKPQTPTSANPSGAATSSASQSKTSVVTGDADKADTKPTGKAEGELQQAQDAKQPHVPGTQSASYEPPADRGRNQADTLANAPSDATGDKPPQPGMRRYKLKEGMKHAGARPGDYVYLTETAAKAFRDKFDPAD